MLQSGTLDRDRNKGFLMSRLRRMQQLLAVQEVQAMDTLTAHGTQRFAQVASRSQLHHIDHRSQEFYLFRLQLF